MFVEEFQKGNIPLAGNYYLKFIDLSDKKKSIVELYHYDILVKRTDISNKIDKKLFIVDAVQQPGLQKMKLAKALSVSRQTIDNYIQIQETFGTENLIHSLKGKKQNRVDDSHSAVSGNKVRKLEEINRKKKEKIMQGDCQLTFDFNGNEQTLKANEQPYSVEHDWKATRYAGVFSYLFPLISEHNWLYLIIGTFGNSFKILFLFILMFCRNIRSVEQIKNIQSEEAGILLGIKKIPGKTKIWNMFYEASHKELSGQVLKEYFNYQIKAGLVGIYTWFIDGHLLPYTGQEKVRYSYNTQRRMPVPGRTNLVTSDNSGRIVSFDIQEGKGDMLECIITT